MALTKAKNADVKKFAQKIIDDHKAAGDKLKTLTAANNMPAPPMALDDFHKRRMDDLTETDGDADFDADYIAAQVDMHKDAIDLVKDYADNPNATTELRSFAMEVLPTLQMHHEMATKLRDEVKKST
jgi:putative membrane protein